MPLLNASLLKNLKKSVPSLILILGCALSAWVAIFVDQQITRDARNTFQQHVLDFRSALDRHFDNYDNILFGIAGMYQITHQVTPEQFFSFAESMKNQEVHRALRSINFARHVDIAVPNQLFEAMADETDGTVMRSAAAARAEHRSTMMVITRAYPPNSPGLGTDLIKNFDKNFTDRPPALSLEQLDTYKPNQVISSGAPVFRPGRPLAGLAARLGIFKKNANGQSTLMGTAGIGFDLKAFFAEAMPLSLASRLQFQMVNIGRANGKMLPRPVLVFNSNNGQIGGTPGKFAPPDHLTAVFDIVFGGALLRTTVIEARSDLVSRFETFLPFAVFAAGTVLFSLLALLSRDLLGQNASLQSAVAKKNADLQLELQNKHALELKLEHSAAEERRRIGRELHDDLGQRLTGISLSAAALAAQLQKEAPLLATHANTLERETSHAIACVRNLAHGLMPVASGAHGLREALANLAQDVSALTHLRCTFDYEDPVAIEDEDIATNLYRITQEALTNAIRHGKASRVSIHLDYVEGKGVLSIADDGMGFDAANLHRGSDGGSGLTIMQHRASVSGYVLSIKSAVGHGTVIRVTEC